MRKVLKVFGIVMVVGILTATLAGTALAAGPLGPNPQAGDGISDGSSLESPNGPCGDCACDECVPNINNYLGPGPHKFQKGK